MEELFNEVYTPPVYGLEMYERTNEGFDLSDAQGAAIYLNGKNLKKILVDGVPQVRKKQFIPVYGKAEGNGGDVLVKYGVMANNTGRLKKINGEWTFVESPISLYGVGAGAKAAKTTAFTPKGEETQPPVFLPDQCVVSVLAPISGVIAYNDYYVREAYSKDFARKDADGNSEDTRTPYSLKFTQDLVTDPQPDQVDSWMAFRSKLAANIAQKLGYDDGRNNPNGLFEILVLGYGNDLTVIQKEGYKQGVVGVTMCAYVVYVRPIIDVLSERTKASPELSQCYRKKDGTALAERIIAEQLKAQAVVNNPSAATVVNTAPVVNNQAPVVNTTKAKTVEILTFEQIQQKLAQTNWAKLRDVQKALICISLCKPAEAKLVELLKSIYPNKIFGDKAFKAAGLDITYVLSHVVANLANLKGEITKHLDLESGYSGNRVGVRLGVEIGREYKAHLTHWASQAGQPAAPATTVAAPVAPVTPAASDEAAAHVQQQQREEAATPATKQQEKPLGFSAVMNAVAKPVAQQEETPVTQEEATPLATPTDKETDWHPNPFGEVYTAEPTNIAKAKVVRSIPFSGKTTASETTAPASETTATPGQDLLGKMLSFFDNTETPQQLED